MLPESAAKIEHQIGDPSWLQDYRPHPKGPVEKAGMAASKAVPAIVHHPDRSILN
jgi:hypothetical protein